MSTLALSLLVWISLSSHFSVLYAIIPGVAIPFCFIDLILSTCMLCCGRKKQEKTPPLAASQAVPSPVVGNKKKAFDVPFVSPPLPKVSLKINHSTTTTSLQGREVDHDKYIKYFEELNRLGASNKVITRIQDFYDIDIIVSQDGKSVEEYVAELTKKNLDGFIHTYQWEGKYGALIANLRAGVDMMHKAFEKCGVKHIAHEIEECSNPCCHATVDIFQANLLKDQSEILEVTVSMDPLHSPFQRAAEFVRVYKQQKMREHLEKEGKEVSKELLFNLSQDESFANTFMRVDLIMEWCIANDLLGEHTTEVRTGKNIRTRMHPSNTPKFIEEVLNTL